MREGPLTVAKILSRREREQTWRVAWKVWSNIMEGLLQDLQKRIAGEVRFDAFSRMLYSTDASIYQIEPIGVVLPRHADDVVATVEAARQHGVPVLPREGGTGLAGQTV